MLLILMPLGNFPRTVDVGMAMGELVEAMQQNKAQEDQLRNLRQQLEVHGEMM